MKYPEGPSLYRYCDSYGHGCLVCEDLLTGAMLAGRSSTKSEHGYLGMDAVGGCARGGFVAVDAKGGKLLPSHTHYETPTHLLRPSLVTSA